jgi:DNA-binding CsgD family transcriptional regulator
LALFPSQYSHRKNLLAKFDVKNTAVLIGRAVKLVLI